MKKILITGKDSYIGNSFKKWLRQWPDKYQVDEVDTKNDIWKEADFSSYDSILHVAGIAHRKETKENEQLYFKINRDLSVEVAKKAKREGVNHFIFLSTMSVYGLTTGIIDENTPLLPKTTYGKSKMEAEQGIRKLQNRNFKVAIVRPPMVYGQNSKGNYSKLSKLAKITPIFPDIENKRSMIYIDNLSEFIKDLVDNKKNRIYHPQNRDYVNTSRMVKEISEVHHKKIRLTKMFNPVFKLLSDTGLIKKVFGSLIYHKTIIDYIKFNQETIFEKTIKLTEDE